MKTLFLMIALVMIFTLNAQIGQTWIYDAADLSEHPINWRAQWWKVSHSGTEQELLLSPFFADTEEYPSLAFVAKGTSSDFRPEDGWVLIRAYLGDSRYPLPQNDENSPVVILYNLHTGIIRYFAHANTNRVDYYQAIARITNMYDTGLLSAINTNQPFLRSKDFFDTAESEQKNVVKYVHNINPGGWIYADFYVSNAEPYVSNNFVFNSFGTEAPSRLANDHIQLAHSMPQNNANDFHDISFYKTEYFEKGNNLRNYLRNNVIDRFNWYLSPNNNAYRARINRGNTFLNHNPDVMPFVNNVADMTKFFFGNNSVVNTIEFSLQENGVSFEQGGVSSPIRTNNFSFQRTGVNNNWVLSPLYTGLFGTVHLEKTPIIDVRYFEPQYHQHNENCVELSCDPRICEAAGVSYCSGHGLTGTCQCTFEGKNCIIIETPLCFINPDPNDPNILYSYELNNDLGIANQWRVNPASGLVGQPRDVQVSFTFTIVDHKSVPLQDYLYNMDGFVTQSVVDLTNNNVRTYHCFTPFLNIDDIKNVKVITKDIQLSNFRVRYKATFDRIDSSEPFIYIANYTTNIMDPFETYSNFTLPYAQNIYQHFDNVTWATPRILNHRNIIEFGSIMSINDVVTPHSSSVRNIYFGFDVVNGQLQIQNGANVNIGNGLIRLSGSGSSAIVDSNSMLSVGSGGRIFLSDGAVLEINGILNAPNSVIHATGNGTIIIINSSDSEVILGNVTLEDGARLEINGRIVSASGSKIELSGVGAGIILTNNSNLIISNSVLEALSSSTITLLSNSHLNLQSNSTLIMNDSSNMTLNNGQLSFHDSTLNMRHDYEYFDFMGRIGILMNNNSTLTANNSNLYVSNRSDI
ncbi:MAG: hypothetical protein FWG98_09605, partial [Candidatus Cloacimonetes bacterium]|nr:hypothetical protein [Candidatus Cloacimonadota bacterium]